ncbi:MAG: indole-3-glycerol-phosphate synthase TrpC, partial [Bacteroidetes bacterium]
VVGVNNRNLETFEVSIKHSLDLSPQLPAEMVKISESGLHDPNAIVELKRGGFQGFLIGEYFMRDEQPGERCRQFIQRIQRLENLLDGAIA